MFVIPHERYIEDFIDFFFFFNDTATTEIYTLSLHDALPICDTTIYFEEEDILIAGDLLYTEVHPVTFFGNIPNWLTSLKVLFGTRYKQLVPGHGPVVEGQKAGREYFKKMYDYLEDFQGQLLEIK